MGRDTDTGLGVAWKCGLLGLIFSCTLDWDHIWFFILKVPDPINLTGIPGRPFHTGAVFLLYALVVSLGILAFIVRRNGGDLENGVSINSTVQRGE